MKKTAAKWALYIGGLMLLAMGITLNTKAGLGVSPIISIAYSVSIITSKNFGNMTFLLYSAFVIIEFILHFLINRRYKARGEKFNLKKTLILDASQLPLSFVFTRFINLFAGYIPECNSLIGFWGSFKGKTIVLLMGIILTGVGAVLSLDMRIIPNPGDGIVQALSDFSGKKVGTVKNCFDLFNICLTMTLSMIFLGHIVGIGIGTILAVIGVGRIMALFNHLFYDKLP
jgi:uncharacterized membrane protein YczE